MSQEVSNPFCERVRASEHAPRGPFNFLERSNGLADIVERGVIVVVERVRVIHGVAALPLGEATARGVSEGVLAHDAHNSYHYADAGRLYELEMLLNAFAIASRRQP